MVRSIILLPKIFMFLLITAKAFSQQKIDFKLYTIPSKENHIYGIRGNVAPLSWEKTMYMNSDSLNKYSISIEFESPGSILEFKFVMDDANEGVIWESTPNRSITIDKGNSISSHIWEVEQYTDPALLALLSSEELMEDYTYLEKMILEVHPGTYRYADSTEINGALRDLREAFQMPLSHGQAFLAINKMIANIQCAHSFASLNDQNKSMQSLLHLGQDKIPFTFRLIEDKMVITHDASQDQILPLGSSVLEINGKPVKDILSKMRLYIGTDGNTPASKTSRLELFGYEFQYDAFDSLYPLMYPIEKAIKLKILDSNGMVKEISTNY